MEIINRIINSFKNLTINNMIDILIGIAIIVFFKIISSSLAYIIIKIFNIRKKKEKIKLNGFYKPLKLFFILLGFYIAFIVLNLPQKIFDIITKIFKICTILLITKGLSNLFDNNSDTFTKLGEKFHFSQNDTTINFISKIIKALIYIVAGFILISELGYDLGGLVAGLGISSVIVALATQDIAKSIISGLSILSDRPFEIGDTIEVYGIIGTVEDISFRTTRIRNSENQIVVLPNSSLITANIINYTTIEKRKYDLTLTLELNTPLNKISSLIVTIKEYLYSQESIFKDTIKVYFNTISQNGIELNIFFYTDIIDFIDFVSLKENVNYSLLQLIEKENIKLAYSTQSVYIKQV